MKRYTANVEKINKDRTVRLVSCVERTAQEAHKDILFKIDQDENILSIFREDGRCVFKEKKGFFE